MYRIEDYDSLYSIEVFEEWNVDKVEIIDGISVASLESIKKQKQALGREKDRKDIELIDEFSKD